jgi:hypothetical protein
MPRRQAVHALSLGRLPIAANHGWREAALIDMDGLQTALNVPRPTAQESSSLPRAALCVACRFFYGSIPNCAAHSKCNGARPRNAERLLPVSCRHACRHDAATPPNPVVGCVRARSLMLQPTGLGPSIHAGSSHFEPSGGFRLASTLPNIINHALAQIQ